MCQLVLFSFFISVRVWQLIDSCMLLFMPLWWCFSDNLCNSILFLKLSYVLYEKFRSPIKKKKKTFDHVFFELAVLIGFLLEISFGFSGLSDNYCLVGLLGFRVLGFRTHQFVGLDT